MHMSCKGGLYGVSSFAQLLASAFVTDVFLWYEQGRICYSEVAQRIYFSVPPSCLSPDSDVTSRKHTASNNCIRHECNGDVSVYAMGQVQLSPTDLRIFAGVTESWFQPLIVRKIRSNEQKRGSRDGWRYLIEENSTRCDTHAIQLKSFQVQGYKWGQNLPPDFQVYKTKWGPSCTSSYKPSSYEAPRGLHVSVREESGP